MNTSYDEYNNGANPAYLWWFGKIYTQNFDMWFHWSGQTPRVKYHASSANVWWYFYNSLHMNLPSEKIVSWIRYYYGLGGTQIWRSN